GPRLSENPEEAVREQKLNVAAATAKRIEAAAPNAGAANGGLLSNLWNNFIVPTAETAVEAAKNFPKDTGQFLWNYNTFTQVWRFTQGTSFPQEVGKEFRVNYDTGGLSYAAGEATGPLVRLTGPYQVFYGNYVRFRGLFPQSAEDAIMAQQQQREI